MADAILNDSNDPSNFIPSNKFFEDRWVIQDCLYDLGFESLSKIARAQTEWSNLNKFVYIIEANARIQKRVDVMDRLWASCLIYG